MQYETATHHSFTIIRFRDGDTVEGYVTCRCCSASSYHAVRLRKIESWELNSPDKAKALAAAEQLTRKYRGRVGILLHPRLTKDRYGRLVNDVGLDGTALSILLVEAGLAWYGVGEPDPGKVHSP